MKALKEGYILFRVNEKYFLSYHNAREYRKQLSKKDLPVSFQGLHWRLKWLSFFISTGKINVNL